MREFLYFSATRPGKYEFIAHVKDSFPDVPNFVPAKYNNILYFRQSLELIILQEISIISFNSFLF